MKAFNNLSLGICFLLICAFVTSCEEKDVISEIAPEISVEPGMENFFEKAMVFSSNGGQQTLNFTTNFSWTLRVSSKKGDSAWCTLSINSGSAGRQSVTVNVEKNEKLEAREVTLTLTAGEMQKNVIVHQQQKDEITLPTNKFEIDGEGGTIDVAITANVSYDVIIPSECDWISRIDTRVASQTLSFLVTKNENYDSRLAEIEIKESDGDICEKIIIEQSGSTIIILSQNLFELDSKGGIISLEIQSNCSYETIMPEIDWIRQSTSSYDITNNKLYFEILPNKELRSRSARIIFRDIRQSKSESIIIKQEQKDTLIVQNKQINVDVNGGKVKINLTTNIPFSVQIPDICNWIHLDYVNQQTISLVVDPNDTYDPREEIVSIIGENNIVEEVAIIQKEKKINVNIGPLNIGNAAPSIHVGDGWREIHKYLSVSASFYPSNPDVQVFFETNLQGNIGYTSKTESSFEVKNYYFEYTAPGPNALLYEVRAVVKYMGKTFYSDWRSTKISLY